MEIIMAETKGSKPLTNRYPYIKYLTNKDVSGKLFGIAMRVCADEFDFVPPTFGLPDKKETLRFEEY
jgi:hypothetical protein